MRELLVRITNPDKVKLVTDILHEIEGVTVERSVVKPKRKVRQGSKVVPAKGAKPKRPLTPKEKKFVRGLKRAVQDMKDHIAGKKKLQTLDEFLNEL